MEEIPKESSTTGIEDFLKVEIRVGTITLAEKHPDADRLLRLEVDFGNPEEGGLGKRQIVSGIAEHFAPESLIGKQCPFITNLEPRTIRGLESQGMILAGKATEKLALFHPSTELPSGTKLS